MWLQIHCFLRQSDYSIENKHKINTVVKSGHENVRFLLLSYLPNVWYNRNIPDTKFSESSFRKLRNDILAHQKQNTIINNKFNFSVMNKNFFIAAGSLIIASFLFLAFINVFGPEKEPDSIWNLASLVGNQKEKIAEVSQLPAGSFGSLATLSSAVNSEGSMEAAPTATVSGICKSLTLLLSP